MYDVAKLNEIAQALGAQSAIDKLSYIEQRRIQGNSELIIPLVGEYSAGKSSLLNALMDSKLETHFDPTTASIFEIRFCCAEKKAVVYLINGETQEVSDVGSLKNKELADSELVRVYDTSSKISATTVLVDTPGLSSLDPRHQKILTMYLPNADLVLLVADINQGVTASALRFVQDMELAKKRIYIVITKCDSKPPSEKEQVRQYIRENTKIPIEKIVCVSANNGQLDELLALIKDIQQDKNRIAEEVSAQRIELIHKELLSVVTELLESSKLSNTELDQKIADANRQVHSAKAQIDSLLAELERSVDQISSDAEDEFNSRIFTQLEEVAVNPPQGNINAITHARIESIYGLAFNNYKNEVFRELARLTREKRSREGSFTLPSLESIDLQTFTLDKVPYNIDMELPELQALNKSIAGGIKVLAVATAAIGVVVATGGLGAVAAAGGAGNALVNVADTASDVGSMMSNRKTQEQIKKFSTAMQENMKKADEIDTQMVQYMPVQTRGFLEGLVSKVTERTHAKPQRKRLIDEFISMQLQPDFKNQMGQVSQSIIFAVREKLYSESREQIEEMTAGLERLKAEKNSETSAFKEKIDLLNNYRKFLEG
jgi:predicted GTPase